MSQTDSPENNETLESIPGSTSIGKIIRKTKTSLLESDIIKAIEVVETILKSSNREINDRGFLLKCLLQFGIPRMDSHIFARWVNSMNESGFGALQYPSEFVDFLRYLMKLDLEDGVEIGVYRGGSSYFMAAVLQRANPRYVHHMVDIVDNLIGFPEFESRLNIVRHIPNSSNDLVCRPFDLVFIDGDHSYDGAMNDFRNLGRFARVAVAFHDIHAHEFNDQQGGTIRVWGEVKEELCMTHEILEFAHSVDRSLGLGLAVKPKVK